MSLFSECAACLFPPDQIGPVLTAHRKLPPRAPGDGDPAEGLRVEREGHGVEHLGLVLGLAQDRQRQGHAHSAAAGCVAGDELAVQLGRHALHQQQRAVHAALVMLHVAVDGVHGALAAGAPEQGIERKADCGRRAVGGAGRLGDGVGEQRRLGVDQEGELVILPERVHLGDVEDVEGLRRHTGQVRQQVHPGQKGVDIPVDVIEGVPPVTGLGVGARGCGQRAQGDTAQQRRAERRAHHLRYPGRLPEPGPEADPDEHRRRRRTGADQRHAVPSILHPHVHLQRPDADREHALPAHIGEGVGEAAVAGLGGRGLGSGQPG